VQRDLIRRSELTLAVASTSIACLAAVDLGHGHVLAPVLVFLLMAVGFTNIAVGRHRAAMGQFDLFARWRDLIVAAHFGAVVLVLLVAPSL
jgi:hypothetical protein